MSTGFDEEDLVGGVASSTGGVSTKETNNIDAENEVEISGDQVVSSLTTTNIVSKDGQVENMTSTTTTTNSLNVSATSTLADLIVNGAFKLGNTVDNPTEFVINENPEDDIVINAGLGQLNLTGSKASKFATTAETLTLDGAAGINIIGNAAEIDLTTTGAIDINGAAITIDGTAGLSLVSGAASNFKTNTGALTLDGNTQLNLKVNNVDKLVVTNTESTFFNNIKIPDDGTIGSSTSADAITINNAGDINLSATTNATSTTTGSFITAGGVGIANALHVGGNIVGGGNIQIPDNGTIGSSTSADAIKINSAGDIDIAGTVKYKPKSTDNPVEDGELVIEATDDTTLTFKLRSGGVTRSATLTLT